MTSLNAARADDANDAYLWMKPVNAKMDTSTRAQASAGSTVTNTHTVINHGMMLLVFKYHMHHPTSSDSFASFFS